MSQEHPIEDQIARFLTDKEREVGSKYTVSFYRNATKTRFLPWALAQGLTDGREITLDQWNAYVDELRSQPLAIASVRTYLNGARIFLKSLDVPLSKFKQPKAKRLMYKILTREEIDRLEECAGNERDKLIVRVLAETGLRLSELTGLTPKDLLLEVPDPLAKHPERYYFIRVLGKGSKERDVPLEEPLFRRLEAFARSGGKRTYIFPALQHDRRGNKLGMLVGAGRLQNNAVDTMFRTLKELAGITKKCTPHQLRHAYITYALTRGYAPMQLANEVGHADLNMITRVYNHLTPVDVAREKRRVFGNVVHLEERPKRRRRIA